MKTITAFVGSARRKHTYEAAQRFLSELEALGDVEGQIVRLADYQLKFCRGCKACIDRGEERCPLPDDWGALFERMLASDGVVLATPNYSFQVSGIMKAFLDRFGFAFHRPRFFGKAFTSIVAQGIYGGDKIVKYLDFVGGGLGFNTVKGVCITTLEPMTAKQERKTEEALAGLARRFSAQLDRPAYPSPTLMKLALFRMSRTSISIELDERFRDYTYYAEQGWFESDYYYPTRLGPLGKAAGRMIDLVAARMARAR